MIEAIEMRRPRKILAKKRHDRIRSQYITQKNDEQTEKRRYERKKKEVSRMAAGMTHILEKQASSLSKRRRGGGGELPESYCIGRL
jgi:hypothetical protein